MTAPRAAPASVRQRVRPPDNAAGGGTLRHIDAYQLVNLAAARKALATLCLMLAGAGYAASWWVVTFLSEVAGDRRSAAETLGAALREIAWTTPTAFVVLFAAHFGTLAVLLAVSLALFKRSSMRRRARAGLIFASLLVAMLDVVIWLTLPFFAPSEHLAAIVAVIEGALLLPLVLVPLKQMHVYRRWRPEDGKTKRVVVVGGGFAGLDTALGIDQQLGHSPDVEIVLIDRNNYFLFPPLLPSVAAGAIETRQVTYPFRRIIETTNIVFRKAEVLRVVPSQQRLYARASFDQDRHGNVVHKTSRLDYDVLVLAPGAEVNTFRTPGIEHAFMMRELRDAILVRNQVIDCFEQAAAATSRARQEELLTFVVAGAGPTGVEVATEIHDLIGHVLLGRYPEIDPALVSVKIVQSGKSILKGWDERVVSTASKQLGRLGIDLILGPRLAEVGPRHVRLNDDRRIPTRTLVWCCGVRPSPLITRAGIETDDAGRALVADDLRAKGQDAVFVVGDSARFDDPATGRPLPPLGQVAFQQGKRCAGNVIALLSGRPLKPFRYFNFGALVSVGEHFAAVSLLGIRLSGFIGWFVWRSLYLGKLVGVSNKIRVMLDWTLDLVMERSISQIAAREEPDDVERAAGGEPATAPLSPEGCRALLASQSSEQQLAAELTADDTGATGLLVRPSPNPLSATIALAATDDGMELRLDADLASDELPRASLSRQNGLLALQNAAGELEIGDEELDAAFIIDGPPDAAALLTRLRGPLLKLGEASAQVDFDGASVRVWASALPSSAEALKPTVDAALSLWAQTAEATQGPDEPS